MIKYNVSGNPFVIEDDTFDSEYFGKTEVIMALGNGYLGTRSTHEENYPYQIRNTFINGTFNKSTPAEVTELPNFPDVIQLIIKIDGERMDLMRCEYHDYHKQLHMDQALLVRRFNVDINGKKIETRFERFVSWSNHHLIGSRVALTSSDDVDVEIISTIDGTQTNSGAMHFTDAYLSIIDENIIFYKTQTTESKIDVNIHLKSVANQSHTKIQKHTHRRMAQVSHFYQLQKNKVLSFDRLAVYQTSRDLVPVSSDGVKTILNQSYDRLFKDHLQSVKDYWAQQQIVIDSTDGFNQVTGLFAQYHLKIMTPYHDERLGVGAKGLTGEGYKGHSFWDTEIFIFPYFLYTDPSVARNLLKFRYLGLEKAKEKAQKNGYKGAQFPWEMAWHSDGEVTPEWGAIDVKTGKPTKIWSGFIEQHITSDIIYALIRYLEVTKDFEFLKEHGLEMIFETAIFWATRAEYNGAKDVYEINDVIGADEYKEHINNNAFTNYMAHFNLRTAVEYYDQYKDQPWAKVVIEKTQWLDYIKQVKEVLENIYLPQPNEEGIIPQDDTYLTLPNLDITPYKAHPQVGTIFHEYSLSQINKLQVSKQADVLMLWHLFPEQFSHETLRKNFIYYESRTLHDSSLSLSTHAVLANQLSEDALAEGLFKKAANIDLGPNMKSSDHGIHAASIGGIWQIIFFGFCGIRLMNESLVIRPKLPKNIQGIMIPVVVSQEKYRLSIRSNEIIIFDKNEKILHQFNYREGEKVVIPMSVS